MAGGVGRSLVSSIRVCYLHSHLTHTICMVSLIIARTFQSGRTTTSLARSQVSMCVRLQDAICTSRMRLPPPLLIAGRSADLWCDPTPAHNIVSELAASESRCSADFLCHTAQYRISTSLERPLPQRHQRTPCRGVCLLWQQLIDWMCLVTMGRAGRTRVQFCAQGHPHGSARSDQLRGRWIQASTWRYLQRIKIL